MAEWTADPKQLYAYQFFRQRGWTPAQAAGIVGGLRGETEDLNPAQSHDNGIGLGIAGWNGQRLRALQQFAAANGTPAANLDTQLAFLDHELRTTEKSAGEALSQANDPGAAGRAMLAYFRPAGWNAVGAHPERARYAQELAGAIGTDGGPALNGSLSPTAANLLNRTAPARQEQAAESVLGMGNNMAAYGALNALGPNQNALSALGLKTPAVPFVPIEMPQAMPQTQAPLPIAQRANAIKSGDMRHVAGPIQYAQGPDGSHRLIIPVDYDPFGGQGV